MADEFINSYDKSPILDSLKNKWFRLSTKDLVYPVAIISLVLVCVIIIGLLWKTQTDLKTARSAAYIGSGLCTDIGCMKTATRAMEYRNTSVDPCEDFYEYACGNYMTASPFKLNSEFDDVLEDLSHDNEDRLTDLLEQPISQMHDYASERKLKQFFQACNDMFTRDKLKGLPILNEVLPALGGWKLIGTWQSDKWDLNSVLKKVQTDFWVNAFYSYYVMFDWNNLRTRYILLYPSGVGRGMQKTWYIDPDFEQIRQDYKKFIRRVGSLLARDAVDMKVVSSSIQSLDTLLDEFVNDTFTVESKLAQISADSPYFFIETNKPTLSQLTKETNNIIDWTQQTAYMFNNARVTGTTKVMLTTREYFKNITDMISSLPDPDRNRMLHNYLIWRVLETYVQDLSWDYIHANRELHVDLHNKQVYPGLYRLCFTSTKRYMGDALGFLYINRHFSKQNRDTVHDITDNILQAMKEQVDKTYWMDRPTKHYAREKLDKILFKMGYPDWMENGGLIDDLYNGMNINVSDHFSNMINGNQYQRMLLNEQLVKMTNVREEWKYPVYSTDFYMHPLLNTISAPAGILQFPIYSNRQPHSASFGSFGSILGLIVHRVVDEWGSRFDLNGNYLGTGQTWWTNQTVAAYKPVQNCVYDVYSKLKKTYVLPDGTTHDMKITSKNFGILAISWISGVRLALIGYRDWMKNLGTTEKLIPGVGLTNERMVFLAHAQSYCYDKSNSWHMKTMVSGYSTLEVMINLAFGQLPEFSDAFQCKPGSKMNHKKKCDYY